MLFFGLPAHSQDTLHFAWDPNPEAEQIAGYVLYYGTESTAFRMILGNTNFAIIPGLTSKAPFRFAVAAYNDAGLEGVPSSMIVWTNLLGTNHYPTLSEFTFQRGFQDVPSEPIAFEVADFETHPHLLTLSAYSSDTEVLHPADIVFEGTGNQRWLMIPKPHIRGSTEVTITVRDPDGATSQRTFTYEVLLANVEPTLDELPPVIVPPGEQQWLVVLSGISSGSPDEQQELTVRAYSSDPNFIPHPDVGYRSPDSYGSLVLTLTPGALGSATIIVMVDDNGRTFSSQTREFVVTVPNALPAISVIGNQTLNEDGASGPLSFSIFDFETPAQALQVRVRSSNPSLISNGGLSLGGTGVDRTLSLRPYRNQFGKALITLTVTDGHGGVASTTFGLQVAPVNDSPGLAPLADIVLQSEMAAVALSGIHSGAGNELQFLSVSAYSDRPDLVPHPVIEYASPEGGGTLWLTPVVGASGTATITVTVSDGQAESTRAFTVTVAGPNQPPVLSDLPEEVTVTTGALAEIPFLVHDDDSNLADLRFELASSNWDLLPTDLMFIDGVGSERTLYVFPMPGLTGGGWVAVVVSDEASTVMTFFSINVVPLE